MKILYTLLWSFTLLGIAQAEEVLIVTWQGKLPSEISFEKRLKELRPSVNFHYIDAKRSKSELATILRNTDLSKFDLVYSFGTTGSKTVSKFLNGKRPQVFNIVSTPVLSGIAKSIKEPGNNLTGARLLISIEIQLELMTKLKKISSLAVWFDPREKQNQALLKKTKEIVRKKGITLRSFRIIPDTPNFDALLSKASKETSNYDALLLLAGSSFHENASKLHSKLPSSLLVIAGTKHFALHGATVALAPDFEERGYVVAEQAHKILGGAPAGKIPISLVTLDNAALFINKSTFATTGIGDINKLGITVKMVDQVK